MFDRDIYTFVQRISNIDINSPIKIHATSDGSAPNFIGSFGWASKISTGQKLAHNYGPAHGFRTSSYRAEGYGLLSMLRLILRAFEYTRQPLPQHIRLHSDSESMLNKLKNMRGWAYYYPNATMEAEWDIIQAMITTTNQFKVQGVGAA